MNKFKKLALTVAAFAAPVASFAEGESGGSGWTPPQVVGDTLDGLVTAGENTAGVIMPYVKSLGLAFLGVTIILAGFGLLRYMIKKATPGSRG